MKKALSIILIAAMILSAALAVGCSKKPRRETGNIEVDYGRLIEDGGTIMYVKYDDGTPLTFMYPNYFSRSSDEEDTFVAKGPDDNSVLMYEVGELSESRSYETIAGYSDADAQDWMLTIQLGLVKSQGVQSIELDDYRFHKLDDHLCLIVDATATYNTGLIQKNTLLNYVLPDGKIYTLHAFSPISAVNKYGPLFKDVKFGGAEVDEPVSPEAGGVTYLDYDTGNITFSYSDYYNIIANGDKGYSLVTDRAAMLAFEPSKLLNGHTYDELKGMSEEELLEYMAGLTAITPDEAEKTECVEEDGHLRLEAQYSSESARGTIYVVAVQYVFPDETTQNFFAYSNEPVPAKNIELKN